MKSYLFILISLTFGIGLVGCHQDRTVSSDPFYRAWYDVYGYYCGDGYPTAGCNFYADGSKIRMRDDPYYRGTVTLYRDYWTYTDSYGYRSSYFGFAWLSPSGILYDQFGNALNETGSDEVSADTIASAAAKEKEVSILTGRALAERYALSEERGIEISKTLQDWAKLGKDRSRTDADREDFSQRLFGLSGARAKSALAIALTTQNPKPLEDLNADVALHWGTTPEVSGNIIRGWYKEEARALGY